MRADCLVDAVIYAVACKFIMVVRPENVYGRDVVGLLVAVTLCLWEDHQLQGCMVGFSCLGAS